MTTPEKDPWIHPDAHPDILAMEQPISEQQKNELATYAGRICLDDPSYELADRRAELGEPHNAVTFIAGSRHVTITMRTKNRFPDLTIMIDEQDSPESDMQVRSQYDTENVAIFRPKTSIRKRTEYIRGGQTIQLLKPDFSSSPDRDYKLSKEDRKKLPTFRYENEMTVAEYIDVMECLWEYWQTKRVFAAGAEAIRKRES